MNRYAVYICILVALYASEIGLASMKDFVPGWTAGADFIYLFFLLRTGRTKIKGTGTSVLEYSAGADLN